MASDILDMRQTLHGGPYDGMRMRVNESTMVLGVISEEEEFDPEKYSYVMKLADLYERRDERNFDFIGIGRV